MEEVVCREVVAVAEVVTVVEGEVAVEEVATKIPHLKSYI
jgi:hypothetical protein